MKTVPNSALNTHQQHMDATKEIAEVFFDRTGRIENMLLEQTRQVWEEQLTFFRAAMAVRDPQALMALNSLLFSHSSEDFIKAQQQILSATIETQSRIWEVLNKYMSVLTTRDESSQTAAAGGDGAADGLFSVWQKSFREAIEQAAPGRAMPPPVSNSGNGPRGKKEVAHTTK